MSQNRKLPATDMRRFRREGERKLLYLVIFTLVVVGGFLIALIFGLESLLSALPCLFGGVVLILIPWSVLVVIERWRDSLETKARNEAGVGSRTKSQAKEE